MTIKTLQKFVMRDTQYLMYYLKKNKQNLEDYEDFCSKEQSSSEHTDFINEVWETMCINLLPYIFTIANISDKEFRSLLIYYIQHAVSAELDVSVISEHIKHEMRLEKDNIETFITFCKSNKVILVSFLSIMQYYFI